ncbi:MAG: hypothetical protein ACXACU_14965 [Candidatus Hodarchaeales archaeon]
MKSDNTHKWLKTKEKELKLRFCQLLTRYAGRNTLPTVIGNAFVKMLESAQRVKVKFTFT